MIIIAILALAIILALSLFLQYERKKTFNEYKYYELICSEDKLFNIDKANYLLEQFHDLLFKRFSITQARVELILRAPGSKNIISNKIRTKFTIRIEPYS